MEPARVSSPQVDLTRCGLDKTPTLLVLQCPGATHSAEEEEAHSWDFDLLQSGYRATRVEVHRLLTYGMRPTIIAGCRRSDSHVGGFAVNFQGLARRRGKRSNFLI